MKTANNPDGFRAILTRVVAINKDRPCPAFIEEVLQGLDLDK